MFPKNAIVEFRGHDQVWEDNSLELAKNQSGYK